MRDLQFEWDEDKAAANLTKHGVSFLTAAEAFANEMVEKIDDREDYGELRFIALGRVDLEVYRVVYSWRDDELRPVDIHLRAILAATRWIIAERL